jgi:Enoyl-(Acyl carrier protein) reductase
VVETAMTASYFQNARMAEATRRMHAVGRWPQPAEIARMILFWASGEAQFVTVATHSIDGGFNAGRPFREQREIIERSRRLSISFGIAVFSYLIRAAAGVLSSS